MRRILSSIECNESHWCTPDFGLLSPQKSKVLTARPLPIISPPETSLDASRLHFVFSGRRGPDLVRSWRICAMGDTPAECGTKKLGWLKTIGGALRGLLSGAIMLYASPLIDKFV